MADVTLLGPQRSAKAEIRFRERLDGSWYGFRLVWYLRANRWFLDIADAAGATIVSGIGVVTDADMLAPIVRGRRPPGQLFVRDDAGLGRSPTRTGWARDFRLIYRPEADVTAAAGTLDEVR